MSILSMFRQRSVSRTAVSNVIQAGIDVVVDQVARYTSQISGSQLLVANECSNVDMSNISMKQFFQINFTQLVTQEAQNELNTAIDSAVKAQAQAEAKGGFGDVSASSETIVNSLINVGQSIKTAAKAIYDQTVSLKQEIRCNKSNNVIFSNNEFEQRAELIGRAIVTQGSVNSAAINVKNMIDALSVSKAAAYDPMGIMLVLAVAAVIVIVTIVVVGGQAQLQAAQKVLGSRYFWLAITGAISAINLVVLLSQVLHYWPYQVVDNLDTEASANTKKSINRAVTGVSGALFGISALASAGILFTVFRTKK